MTKPSFSMSEWEERFDKEYAMGTGRRWIFTKQEAKEIKSFIAQEIDRAETQRTKYTAMAICDLIDDIELKHRNTSLEEWKQYKHIRNAIRDKFLSKEKGSEWWIN